MAFPSDARRAGDRAIHRLLVFSPDDAGEMVLIVPAMRVLKRSYPLSWIILMATPATVEAAGTLPFTDAVLERGTGDEAGYIEMIARLSCDGAVIFTGPGQSPYPDAYRCYLAGIPFRIGESCEFGGGVLSHWVRTDRGVCPVDRYLSLVNRMLLDREGI